MYELLLFIVYLNVIDIYVKIWLLCKIYVIFDIGVYIF